ncbi:beta/gamma crystallin family protein, partial [Candidatus Saccharibacteria bacterium]|nr:beta/gamma crystallin family protein [Candidatus Saccharibacteria bacterium]
MVVGIIFAFGFASFGVYRQLTSSAATLNNAKNQCILAGRVYNDTNSTCAERCAGGDTIADNVYKIYSATNTGYCSKAVVHNISQDDCVNTLHRRYINSVDGCARLAKQVSTNNAQQCQADYPNYKVVNPGIDKCTKDTVEPVTVSSGSSGSGSQSGNTAATVDTDLNQNKCEELFGRIGKTIDVNGKSTYVCERVCQAGAGSLVQGTQLSKPYYCNKTFSATATISQAKCQNLNRKWVNDIPGCARRIDNVLTANAVQCSVGYPQYTPGSTADNAKCTVAAASPSDTPSGGSESTGGVATGSGEAGSSSATGAGFKIVVYKQKDFKGESKTFTAEQADLAGTGFNDKISSYKIVKGEWQLCDDADYLNCTKRWASDADLSGGKHNDKFSSLRPVTKTTYADPEVTVVPQCIDEDGVVVPLNADKLCPDTSSLGCEDGYVIVDGECKIPVVTASVYIPVDTSFKKTDKKGDVDGEKKCLLLGRQWIGHGNGGEHGCSMVTCNLEKDGAPRKNDGKPYCVSYKYDAAYAVQMNEKQCKALNRVWIEQVGRCAQVPNRKDKDQTKVKAPQCTGNTTTYYIFKAKDKEDECFNPTFFQRAKGVANVTGGVLGNVLRAGPRAFCTAKPGYHWDGHANACRKDPPPPP